MGYFSPSGRQLYIFHSFIVKKTEYSQSSEDSIFWNNENARKKKKWKNRKRNTIIWDCYTNTHHKM